MSIITVFKLSIATVGTALIVGATAATQAATINGIGQEQTSSNLIKSFSLVSSPPAPPSSNQITRVSAPKQASAPTSNLTLNGPWYQFSFSQIGVPAQGCAPTDPNGLNCDPGSVKNSVFVDAPAWKFVAPEAGATLKVTDAFFPGDLFDVFDFGNLIGSTSAANDGDTCGDNPDTCFADPLLSKGVFNLASGTHSITIIPTASPFEQGSAYFRIDAAAKSVPEPTSILGVLAVLGGAGVLKKRKATAM